MHMADALISPAVGGVMLAASAGIGAYCVKKTGSELDHQSAPLMGVTGAMVFAMQMINIAIPGTGSSGHIAGGLLLSAILGPHAAYLTMASVLLLQALFFADGGLLAYGCNLFNLGFFSCFIGYLAVYRPTQKDGVSGKRIWLGSLLSCVLALQLGALGVVFETVLSGKTALQFTSFAGLMLPIHLVIGLLEGIITASVLTFVHHARPELLSRQAAQAQPGRARMSFRAVLAILLGVSLLAAVVISRFASSSPDGLEWSILRLLGTEPEASGGAYDIAGQIVETTALLPDYGLKTASEAVSSDMGTSLAGLVGCLVLVGGAALLALVRRVLRPRAQS